MSRRGTRSRALGGVALLEVVVAVVVLAVGMVAALRQFANGVRAKAVAGDYGRAGALADGKMNEIEAMLRQGAIRFPDGAPPVNLSGTFNERFRWEAKVALIQKSNLPYRTFAGSMEKFDVSLLRIWLAVKWERRGGEYDIVLATLVAPPPEEFGS